jgi:hypothetical protein
VLKEKRFPGGSVIPYLKKSCPLLLACASVFICTPAFAAQYDVGPGRPYATPAAVPWESLMPGDTVLIYWRSTPYTDKWVICRQGTAAQPITISGVAGPAGELPVIDGTGATTRPALNYWNGARGVIKIGGANIPADTMPRHIVIENLDVRGARPGQTFSDPSGVVLTYAQNAAAIYIEKGEQIVLRNNRLHDSGNGLFIGSGGATPSRNLLVEGNYIYDNGNVGSAYEHNSYTEAFDITFQFNRFGTLKAGAGGNNLKDRSAGLVVRNNWIEGGNRQLDLVDSHNPLITGDPRYRQSFVYGNVLIERLTEGNRQIVMYGGDSGDTPTYRNGTLYFYNNTVVSYRTDRTTLFFLPTNDQRIDARNNIFFVTAAGNTLSVVDSAGFVDLLNNWLKPGFVSTFSSLIGMVNGSASSIVGTSPGFAAEGNEDFTLAAGSSARDAGTPLSNYVVPAHVVAYEYVRHLGGRTRPADAAMDLGAYEVSSGVIVPPLEIITTSLPPGEASTPYIASLSASGGVPLYSWSITSGRLPAGLTLDGGSGVIAGTPSEAGTFGLTLQVAGTDSNTASASLSLAIASAPAQPNPVRIAVLDLPDARRNKNYRQTLTATGGVQPYLWNLSAGVLPPGLSLNSATGLISGRPTTAGTWSFIAVVSDQQSPASTDQRTLAITVR